MDNTSAYYARAIVCKDITIKVILCLLAWFCTTKLLLAEGSIDLLRNNGYRLFYSAEIPQQLKVYVNMGEFINVGASHVGISGGYIAVYRPDGSLHTIFNDAGASAGLAIIQNEVEEKNGPTGGGTSNGAGYKAGIIDVKTGESGIWTVVMGYPTCEPQAFQDLLNTEKWTRAMHQPTSRRAILAWDVTITKNNAGNKAGIPQPGRLYTNEFTGLVNNSTHAVSPVFLVLNHKGFLYKTTINDTETDYFTISANANGLVNNQLQPRRTSDKNTNITRTTDIGTADKTYLYEPQAADKGSLINHKLFFNTPDTQLPANAPVTDIVRGNLHQTWLTRTPFTDLGFADIHFVAKSADGQPCVAGAMQRGVGGWIKFKSFFAGKAKIEMDLNNDTDYKDAEDRILYKEVKEGIDSIFWDGKLGNGVEVGNNNAFVFNYRLTILSDGTHVLLNDVDKVAAFSILLTNPNGQQNPAASYWYDHTKLNGGISGGNVALGAQPIVTPSGYPTAVGNLNLINYWAFNDLQCCGSGTLSIQVVDFCVGVIRPDSDNDGVLDIDDLDDDNDGVSDKMEFCQPTGGFACLTGGFDPSKDNDNDGIPNYNDANDPSLPNNCTDANRDGRCDSINRLYDFDGDGVPNHLDLDADNDGISDLQEAGHNQPDLNGDGVIDGDRAAFGKNGLYDKIDSDPTSFNAVATYKAIDFDGDAYPDYADLDSDNDGINDISESGLVGADSDNDGFADGGAGIKPLTDRFGVLTFIAPSITKKPFPTITDTDGDGVPNFHDLDSDNDGIFDVVENDNSDSDNDGFIGKGKPVVNDRGQAKGTDNGVAFAAKSSLTDWDEDGVPDYNDLDSDNDGIHDVTEGNNPDGDGNGLLGTGIVSVNTYGVAIGGDGGVNFKPTSTPADTDGDIVPDFRDRDSDNDGINDVVEGGNADRDNDGVIGFGTPVVNAKGQATRSNDGLPLAPTSKPTDTDADGIADYKDLDSDADKISDVIEGGNADPDGDNIIGFGKPKVNKYGQATADAQGKPLATTSNPTDTDGDKKPDFQDIDSDGDCLSDLSESVNDADADGKPNFRDTDRDGDGLVDNYECESCATGNGCIDTDKDGIPDVDDLDSDDDGLSDKEECPTGVNCPDSNGNGLVDWRDPRCRAEAALANIKGNGTYCTGAEIELSATNTSSVRGNITYTWEGPAGYKFSNTVVATQPLRANFSATTPTQTGTYVLTTSGGAGCTAVKQTVNVVVTAKLASPSISAGADTLCTGSTLRIRATNVSDPNYKYDWYFNNIKIRQTPTNLLLIDNATALNSGSYWVRLVADGACSSDNSAPLRITVKAASLNTTITNATTSDKPACEGASVQLNVPFTAGATYQWFGPNGFDSRVNNPVISPAAPKNAGEYFVQIATNGCTAVSAKSLVYINPKPEKPTAAANTIEACAGADLALSTTKPTPIPLGTKIKWYKNSLDSLVSSNADGKLALPKAAAKNSGNYFAVYELNGCNSEASNTLAILVSEASKEVATVSNKLAYTCGADAFTVKATTPALSMGTWSANGLTIQNPANASTSVGGLKKGKNTVFWTLSMGGCKNFSRDSVVLVYEDEVEAKPDIYKMAFNTTLNNNISLNDVFGNITGKKIEITKQPTKGTVTLEQDGRFKYEPKTNAFGKETFIYKVCNTNCTGVCDTAVVNINISGLDQNDGVFIPNIITPNGDGANDAFVIPAAAELGNMELMVYDRWGQRVYVSQPYKNDWRGTYNDKPLPAGTYYYLVKLRPTDENCLQGCVNIVR